jgi:hypothetical protein
MIVKGFMGCCVSKEMGGMEEENGVGNVGSIHENVKAVNVVQEVANCEDIEAKAENRMANRARLA